MGIGQLQHPDDVFANFLVAVAVKAPMTGRMGSVRTNSGIFK